MNVRSEIYAIISDVSKGDMDAFGELYDALSDRVFNYARTIIMRHSSKGIEKGQG